MAADKTGAAGLTIGQPFNPYKMFMGILIPEAICRHTGLTLGAKMTYGRLCRYAGKDGKAYPSVGSIGAEIALSAKQARRYVRELESASLIKVERETGKSSHYVFLWHAAFIDTPPIDGSTPPPEDGSTTPPIDGSQRESVEENHVEERNTNTDIDCPPTNRKKRDSSPDAGGVCASTCKQYPKLREMMGRYMADDPKAKPEDYPPDRSVVETMEAARIGQGHPISEKDVIECLIFLFNERGLRPGTKNGPRHFSWFATVVQDYFDGRRRRDEVTNPIVTVHQQDPEEAARYDQYAEILDSSGEAI